MELRKAYDAILRCHCFPVALDISSSTSVLRYSGLRKRPLRGCIHRASFHTCPRRLSKPTKPNAAPTTYANPPPRTSNPYDDHRQRASQNLGWLAPNSSLRRKSPFASPSPSEMPSLSGLPDADSAPWGSKSSTSTMSEQEERLLNGGNSAADILRGLKKLSRTPFHDPQGAFGQMENPSKYNTSTDNTDSSFSSSLRENLMGNEVEKDLRSAPIPDSTREKIELRPKLGRTINVDGNVDVARAMKLLDISCAINRVKRDESMQKRYERAGAKRKRLRRERWRRCFKTGFQHICQRAHKLAKQGW